MQASKQLFPNLQDTTYQRLQYEVKAFIRVEPYAHSRLKIVVQTFLRIPVHIENRSKEQLIGISKSYPK